MAHVVMQAAEFPTQEAASKCEAELRLLFDAYVKFEKTDPDPWGGSRVAPPLVEFGRLHGIDWPHDQKSRFLLKGTFEDAAELVRIDRVVFFWGGGFDLGGPTLQTVMRKLGATAVAQWCHLRIAHDEPAQRLSGLTTFLDEDAAELEHALFSITIESGRERKYLLFDDSGVQDWAFVAAVRQLDGEDPQLVRSDPA